MRYHAPGSWLIHEVDIFNVENVNRVALPKQERADQCPNLLIIPMFAEDVSGISYSLDMVESDDFGSDGLAYAVKGQSHVTLVELGVGSNGTFYDSLVASKHVASAADGNPEVWER